ncbi:receptor-transporting protein 3-like [Saccoglossus kowalevskii]|uniref:Uncharacterized protein LOC100374693 n=1 Tax=Saccoglossus kowalevskii TaxID=10224 RepID=A0ABM0GV52_SACKO|nr:PREDICTED: uncharacterized protein LOC100374693 [Saccoglossus kowalevskii]
MPEYRSSPVSLPKSHRLSKNSVKPLQLSPMLPEKLTSVATATPYSPVLLSPVPTPLPPPPLTPVTTYTMLPQDTTHDMNSIEALWHGEFSKLFVNYMPHVWYISPIEREPNRQWKRFRDSAKVRFCCQKCGHGWTSMKGRIMFWFTLNQVRGEGILHFKLYGQQCQRCQNGDYEFAMWYPEEVYKVLCNVYNRVGQNFYGFPQQPYRVDRRIGKPRRQHNADLCQACRDGECDTMRHLQHGLEQLQIKQA